MGGASPLTVGDEWTARVRGNAIWAPASRCVVHLAGPPPLLSPINPTHLLTMYAGMEVGTPISSSCQATQATVRRPTC